MKRFFFLPVLLLPIVVMGQSVITSNMGSVNIVKEIKPAILDIVPNSIQFVDVSDNNAIDATEANKLVFKVHNKGTGDGYGCVARVTVTGTTSGISVQNNQPLSVIPINGIQTIEVPITSDMNTADGQIELTLQVDEPNGFGTIPHKINIDTRAFVAPFLQVADYTITGSSSVLERRTPFDLQVLVQNVQHGLAEDVMVDIELPSGVYIMGGTEHTIFPEMTGGEQKSLVYTLATRVDYAANTIPVQVNIREKHGKYAKNELITLQLNQTMAVAKLDVQSVQQERKDIQLASLTSAVDKNLPENPTTNTNTFAFIIANENYQNKNFAQVPYALNDGSIFRNYCVKTLGIPENQVKFAANATYAQMREFITKLRNTADVNPDSKIILYYAGHGAPSEGTQEAFLIPIDAYQVGESCISLQSLYNELKDLKDSRITIFLDACFSGANRDNTMIAAARGVAIAPKTNTVQGNLVVFSASTGSETAWPYKEEGHGMFTYFLLKKLQETAGDVTYQALYDYLYSNVRRTSNNVNEKIQTPTINSSVGLGDEWKGWKLR